MSKHQRLARLIEMITVVKYHPDWGPKRLAQYFEISEKRIYDDINTLNAANVPIVYNGAGYSFLNSPALPPVQFTLEEAMSLLACGAAIPGAPGGACSPDARSAGAKLLRLLPSATRAALLELAGRVQAGARRNAGDSAMLNRLQRALAENASVRFSYRSFSSGQTTLRTADPYAVVFRGNAWYMIGHCHLRGGVRTFRVNRMSGLRASGGSFAFPAGFSLEAHLDKSWSIFQGDEEEVRVRFDNTVAPLIVEHQWRPDQKIQRHDDGSVTFSATVKGTLEIRRWILSWGEHAEVLAPESLRNEMRAITAALGNMYGHRRGHEGKILYKVAEKTGKYKPRRDP